MGIESCSECHGTGYADRFDAMGHFYVSCPNGCCPRCKGQHGGACAIEEVQTESGEPRNKLEAVCSHCGGSRKDPDAQGAIDPPCKGCGLPEPNRNGHLCIQEVPRGP